MKKNFDNFYSDLIKHSMEPKRMQRYSKKYGIDKEDAHGWSD